MNCSSRDQKSLRVIAPLGSAGTINNGADVTIDAGDTDRSTTTSICAFGAIRSAHRFSDRMALEVDSASICSTATWTLPVTLPASRRIKFSALVVKEDSSAEAWTWWGGGRLRAAQKCGGDSDREPPGCQSA